MNLKISVYIFIAVCFLFITNCRVLHYSTSNDLQINITADASINGTKFKIAINRHHDIAKIVYYLRDSVRDRALEQDTAYQRLKYAFLKNVKSADVKGLVEKMRNKFEQYEVYDKDSISVNLRQEQTYAKLLNQISTADRNQLENNKRIVIDGIYVSYRINVHGNYTLIDAPTPNATSHPLLYQLLKQSLELYRGRYHNNFLNKKRTFYY